MNKDKLEQAIELNYQIQDIQSQILSLTNAKHPLRRYEHVNNQVCVEELETIWKVCVQESILVLKQKLTELNKAFEEL